MIIELLKEVRLVQVRDQYRQQDCIYLTDPGIEEAKEKCPKNHMLSKASRVDLIDHVPAWCR